MTTVTKTKKKPAPKLTVRQQIDAFNQMAETFHANSAKKGFWDKTPDLESRIAVIPEKLMLIVSEAAEALEDYRNPHVNHDPVAFTSLDYDLGGKPVGFASELADIIIRTAELAAALKINLGKAVMDKHAYNKTRGRMHGDKKI
jgi:hypothetical protein